MVEREINLGCMVGPSLRVTEEKDFHIKMLGGAYSQNGRKEDETRMMGKA